MSKYQIQPRGKAALTLIEADGYNTENGVATFFRDGEPIASFPLDMIGLVARVDDETGALPFESQPARTGGGFFA